MRQRIGWLVCVVLLLEVATACDGHPRQLGDGLWYGKLTSVSVAHRTTTFASACRFSEGRWIATNRDSFALAISPHADLEIYFRPNGAVVAGHAQTADLKLVADVTLRGDRPDSPSGWFVTVRDHVAVSISEDSDVSSLARADQRTFACVWSSSTRAFVAR